MANKKEEDTLPIVESVGMAKIPGKGYSVVAILTQGEKFLERQVLTEPEPRGVAFERLKIEIVRRFWGAKN